MADEVWSRKAGLGDAELDGERVLWAPDTGEAARLDRIGSLVWACLDGTATLDELTVDLAAAFDAPPTVVRADLAALLERLRALGLVVEVRRAGP